MIRYMMNKPCAPDDDRMDIYDLPPSAKLVFKMLHYKGGLTQKQLTEETQLAPRTVRYAIQRLDELGLVTSEISLRDARQDIYSLPPDEKEVKDTSSK